MTPASPSRSSASHGLSLLVEELTRLLQSGEAGQVEAFIARHPDQADQLRELLPTMQGLVGLRESGVNSADLGAADVGAAGGTLGDFRIVRQIGRGGMGIVYEAEQLSLKRRVALKVLPFASTLDPRQLQRFKNEAQAAASLHHTNIVPVHSVGCERGVHFYAMQYVEGQSLAEVIGDLRLAIGDSKKDSPAPATGSTITNRKSTITNLRGAVFFRTVAELGIQAAEALDHAHLMGIVHRDVKPANLLLEATSPLSPLERGAAGEGSHCPRLWITDFGLAQVQSDVKLTMTGDFLGTLRYVSPEQALSQREIVDQRTDVYSLGVTLYELLTLRPAFDGDDRQEILRKIAQEEPRPPRKINRAIPAELETIVLKAMEKRPEERYETAGALAKDLRRWLEEKPILARKPNLVQRARKWGRRHQAIVFAAGVVLAVVIVGLLAGLALVSRHNSELARLNAELAGANTNLINANNAEREARNEAEEQAAITKAVSDFLQQDLLEQTGEGFKPNSNLTMKEVLDRAVARIGDRFQDRPLVEAAIQRTIGECYYGVAQLDKSILHLERAAELLTANVGREHHWTMGVLQALALSYKSKGRFGDSIRENKAVLEYAARELGPAAQRTLVVMGNLALAYEADGQVDEAVRLLEEVLTKRTESLGPYHVQTLHAREKLGAAYRRTGRKKEAIRLLENARDQMALHLGPDAGLTLGAKNNLALAYKDVGRVDEAIQLLEQTHDECVKLMGRDNTQTLIVLANLADVFHVADRLADARERYEYVVAQRALQLRRDHYLTQESLHNLAVVYLDAGMIDAAIRAFEEVRDCSIRRSGPNHESTLTTMECLAVAYRDGGRTSEAIEILEQVRVRREETLGAASLITRNTKQRLGETLLYHQEYERAEKIGRELLETDASRSSGFRAASLALLGQCSVYQGKFIQAEPLLRQCLAIGLAAQPNDWRTANAQAFLGRSLLGQRRYEDAETMLLHGFDGMKQRETRMAGLNRRYLTENLESLVELYEAWNKPDQAAEWRGKLEAEKAKLQTKKTAPDKLRQVLENLPVPCW